MGCCFTPGLFFTPGGFSTPGLELFVPVCAVAAVVVAVAVRINTYAHLPTRVSMNAHLLTRRIKVVRVTRIV